MRYAVVADKRPYLPRFGVRMFMNNQFDQVEYYGYGPYESYIDKHQASYMGVFSQQVSEMHEDYIKPQENSSHWGCEYVKISSKDTLVLFEAAEVFSFNASEYTQEELSAKKHLTSWGRAATRLSVLIISNPALVPRVAVHSYWSITS
ncbi:hypothetical protein GE107_23105 [Cohnella sp. CFH 77786]|nr:beta-galactosidase small subunit [Cohnella sp. CFH 77786]MBW5448934.1 hypothetical protein [Cohnella sp. CFH 77786]